MGRAGPILAGHVPAEYVDIGGSGRPARITKLHIPFAVTKEAEVELSHNLDSCVPYFDIRSPKVTFSWR